MKYIYIAAPYTKGDVVLNVRRAWEVAEKLIEKGYVPFVPHLTHLAHLMSPHDYQYWLDYDNHWIKKCDILLRLSGESKGADDEVELAKLWGIPVCYDIDNL